MAGKKHKKKKHRKEGGKRMRKVTIKTDHAKPEMRKKREGRKE